MRRRSLQGWLCGTLGSVGAGAWISARSEEADAKRLKPSGLAPDPNTSIPKFKAPAGAVGTHCHIFGPAAQYPYSPKRSYTPHDAGLDDFRKVHAKMSIERVVIVNASLYDIDSRVVVDEIASSGGQYRGIANIDDRVSDAELDTLHQAGIRGCRFNFVKHLGGLPDMAVFDRSVKRIARLGWHVDLHFDVKDLPDFYSMLDRLPVPYIIDHMGRVLGKDGLEQQPFKVLPDLLERDKKCHVKFSGADRVSATGTPFLDAVPFARRLVETAADSVLWGSDWPHLNVKTMPNDGDLVDLIPLYAPDPRTQKQILIDNPMRLYQFEA